MKRLPRFPEKFEVIDLFTSLGRTHEFILGAGDGQGEFLKTIERSLDASIRNPILLHGRRVQSMFSYVVASLGRATLIKEEDAGEIFVSDPTLRRVPDFSVVLVDGSSFLVEVKNYRGDPRKPLVLKRAYLESLEGYARLLGRTLRFAIYWSLMNLWTLVSVPHIPRVGGHGRIDLLKAMKINEMADLGDMEVATTPPLVLRILTDPMKPRQVGEGGKVEFTIGQVELYCNGVRIESEDERRLAWYFMLYGNWTGGEPEAHIEDGALIYIDFEANHPAPVAGQEFQMLGYLSGMISRRFNDLTAPEGTIERLVPRVEPGSLGIVIPDDYKGTYLHLWRFILRPNYD